MENEHSWEKNSNTHTLKVGGSVPAWGTVLFVLSDSATHFCLAVHELNHFKALKGDYPGVRWRARYLFGWLYRCLYAEVAAGPRVRVSEGAISPSIDSFSTLRRARKAKFELAAATCQACERTFVVRRRLSSPRSFDWLWS